MADREEFLPPLEVLAAADRNVVPYAVSGLGNGARLKQAVGVGQTAFDAGILAVHMEDAALQCTRRCDRVCAQNHHVGRVEVDAEHRVGSLTQLEQGRSRPNHGAREFLDSDVLNAALFKLHHERFTLACVREQFGGVAVLACAPAAGGHLDRVNAEGLYLVEHIRVGQVSEYVGADCEFHINLPPCSADGCTNLAHPPKKKERR